MCCWKKGPQEVPLSFLYPSQSLELPNVHINTVLEAQSPCFSHPGQRSEEQGLGLGPVQSPAMAFHWSYI